MIYRRLAIGLLAAAIPVGLQSFVGCTNAHAPQSAAAPRKEAWNAATQPRANGSGEKTASEDAEIWSFHPLGDVDGVTDLYRSACPIRDVIKRGEVKVDSPEAYAVAVERVQRLYDKGIRTIVSFENPGKGHDQARWIALEKKAAEKVGMRFVSLPLANSGPDSFETLSPEATMKLLDHVTDVILADAKSGGVDMHCSAGHDRTGIVVAYLRMKYQHWSADKAIDEMRFYGHNWPQFSRNGGQSSWHEDSLRQMAALMR